MPTFTAALFKADLTAGITVAKVQLPLTLLTDLTLAIGVGVAIGLALRLRRRDVPEADWHDPER